MRRATLRLVYLGAVVALTFQAFGVAAPQVASGQAPNYRDVAINAAKWIRSTRVETLFGYAWLSDPNDPKSISTSLYTGSPGVILFMLELHQATGDAAYLDQARRGADELMTKVPSETRMGFYEGVAGLGFTLGETWRATRDEKYRKAALSTVRILGDKARPRPSACRRHREGTDRFRRFRK